MRISDYGKNYSRHFDNCSSNDCLQHFNIDIDFKEGEEIDKIVIVIMNKITVDHIEVGIRLIHFHYHILMLYYHIQTQMLIPIVSK